MTDKKKRLVILPKSQQVKSELMEKYIAARSAARESAMQELASLGQAAEAHVAQLKAEAMAKKLAAAIRDMGHTATDEAVSALAEYEASSRRH